MSDLLPRPVLAPAHPRVERIRRRARTNVISNVRGSLRVEALDEELRPYSRERADLDAVLAEFGL